MEARAYGGELDQPYDHPLLSTSAAEILAVDRRSAQEILHDLLVRTTFDGTEGDSVVVSMSVETVEREDTGTTLADAARGEWLRSELPLVGDTVRDSITRADTGVVEALELWVSLDRLSWNPIVSVEQELLLAMIEGRVDTQRDAMQVRHDALTEQEAAGTAALEPVLAQALDGVAHIDEVTDDVPAAGYPLGTEVDGTTIDGEELENLLQSTQFYDSGYYGDSDGYIGQTEGGYYPDTGNNMRRSHLGFDSAAGVDRFDNCYDVSGSTCGSNPDPDPGDHHATMVASTMLGDITQGQDPGVPYAGRTRRSGVARRAHGLGDDSNTVTTPEIMTAAGRDIHLLNHSAGSTTSDCTGTTTIDQAWNGMFEDGIAVINAAGNDGHSTSDCTVIRSGSALGVFTVGAYQVDGSDDEVIYPDQSRGGGEYCPGGACSSDGRTLIDVLGPTNHEFAYSEDSSTSDQYPYSLCCTSGATPSVTGAAALFRDWHLDVAGTSIDSPGVLYASLLLMGDRMAESRTWTW